MFQVLCLIRMISGVKVPYNCSSHFIFNYIFNEGELMIQAEYLEMRRQTNSVNNE